MLMQLSTQDNYSHYYSLSEICCNYTHSREFSHRSTEHADSDWHNSRYLMSSKIIHKAINFTAVSADRAAAIQENKSKQVK